MLMLDRAFKFTGKDLTKLSIMIVVATLLFGLPGLVVMLLAVDYLSVLCN